MTIKTRLLCYWLKLCSPANNNKLSSLVYRCLVKLKYSQKHENLYIKFVETTLNELGMSNIWLGQFWYDVHPGWFKEKVKRTLKDNFLQDWYSCLDNNSMFTNYRKFKLSFGPDPYYTLLPSDCVVRLLRFRTTTNTTYKSITF